VSVCHWNPNKKSVLSHLLSRHYNRIQPKASGVPETGTKKFKLRQVFFSIETH